MRNSVLLAVLACAVVTGTAHAADRCTVREAQQALTEQGFEPGPIDGAMGRLTRSALIAFQKANDLRATGYLNPDTCRALTEPPATAAQPTPQSAAQSGANQPDNQAAPASAAPQAGTPAAPVPAADTATPQASPTAVATPSGATASQAEPTGADAAASATPAATTEQTPDTSTDAAPAIPAVAAVTPPAPPAPPAPPPEPGYKRITDPVALYRTAFGLHKSGSYYVAANAFEHYLRTFGDHDRVPDALYWLSEAYVLTGQDNEARESLEQFLTAFPGHRYTDEVRSRLDGISPVTQ